MIDFARFFSDGSVPYRWNHTLITFILIGVKSRPLTVHFRNIFPQLLSTFLTSITDMKGDNLTGVDIHSKPNPLLIIFVTNKTP